MNIRLTRRIEALEKRQPTTPEQNVYIILPSKDDEALEENPTFERRGPGIYAVFYRPEPGIEEEIDRRIAAMRGSSQR